MVDCNGFIISTDIATELKRLTDANRFDKTFLLVDSNTRRHCLPQLHIDSLNPIIIEIEPGDQNKNIETLTLIWDELINQSASRHSLLINLGGGVVCDIGGFAATTFKRGMPFINIPTTILAAVDAATGGKTGINYKGLKNEIGAFAQPVEVIINPQFFATLDTQNLLSGYAEMVKHALLSDKQSYNKLLTFDVERFDLKEIGAMLEQNITIKNQMVECDPCEHGIRKALNLGHTFGHAFETLSHKTDSPLPHGYAVMWGMTAELYLSVTRLGLESSIVTQLLSFAKQYYGSFQFTCKEYDAIYDLMKHDKKNSAGNINCTLLSAIGEPKIDCTLSHDEIFEALDFIREN